MKKSNPCSRFVEFEERAASLYLNLAHRFTRKKDLSLFWLDMSMEEKQHGVLLNFCGREQIIKAKFPGTRATRKLSDFFSGLESRASQKRLSVDDAFLIAAELESSEINDIFGRLIRPVPGTWYIIRKKIETLAGDHMERLIRGARKFGVSAPAMAKITEIKRRSILK